MTTSDDHVAKNRAYWATLAAAYAAEADRLCRRRTIKPSSGTSVTVRVGLVIDGDLQELAAHHREHHSISG